MDAVGSDLSAGRVDGVEYGVEEVEGVGGFFEFDAEVFRVSGSGWAVDTGAVDDDEAADVEVDSGEGVTAWCQVGVGVAAAWVDGVAVEGGVEVGGEVDEVFGEGRVARYNVILCEPVGVGFVRTVELAEGVDEVAADDVLEVWVKWGGLDRLLEGSSRGGFVADA